MQTLEAQAADLNQTMTYLLSRLRVNAPAFVAMIEELGVANHGPENG
jgi:hypothetical protein